MIESTQGRPIPGLTILQRINDPLRLCTIYATEDGNLVVGFGGTRDNLVDWLANLQPEAEAASLLIHVAHWLQVYQPSKVTLVGHSQGGAHALIIAERMKIECEVITYGGLPIDRDSDCKTTHYLNRADPMAWVPWWLFGLKRFGVVKMIGKPVLFPSIKGHDPKTYEELLCRK